MILARFKANEDDYRPVNWPIKHPYWCTGSGEGYSTIVAYADDVEEIKSNWPEASAIELMEQDVDEYRFSDRFPRPDWLAAAP